MNHIQFLWMVGVLKMIKFKIYRYFPIFIFLIIFRLLITLSHDPIYDIYDSPRYFEFQLIDAFRLPVITGIYAFIEDHRSIVIFQSILSSISWIFLFIAFGNFLKKSISRNTLLVFIIFFSYTQIAIFRDSYLTSESINLSLILILISIFFIDGNYKYKYMFISTVLMLFAGIKNQNAFLTIPILLYFFMKNSVNKSICKKIKVLNAMVISLSLLTSSYFIQLSLSDSTISTLNTAAHINFRFWSDDDWKDQLLKSGYPPELRTIWRDFYSYNRGLPPSEAVIQEAKFKSWWDDSGGDNFLISFTLSNVDYLILGPLFLPMLNEKLNFAHTLTYGMAQDPNYFSKINNLPNPLEVYWLDDRDNSYLSVSLIFLIMGTSLLYLSKKSDYLLLISKLIGIVIFIGIWSLLSWYVATKLGIDILRNSEPLAIIIRLVTVYLLILIFDISKFKRFI